MTAPRGGKTTVTSSGRLRRCCVALDEYSITRLDSEVELLRQKGKRSPSRSDVLRRLVREHLTKEE